MEVTDYCFREEERIYTELRNKYGLNESVGYQTVILRDSDDLIRAMIYCKLE